MSAAPDAIPLSLQELLPKWAHFCLYIERFLTHELGVNVDAGRVVVGLSGGVDSTALLLVHHYLAKRNDGQVIAVHLNHNLRDEAAADAAWASELCKKLGIPCIVESVDVAALAEKEGVGVEEAGRSVRYSLFQRVLEDEKADYISVGHHLDDLSEDVLMRLIRGAGWPALSGMCGHDPERKLLRPLLMLPKSTLRAFVSHVGIMWREDSSNADNGYLRNRVRNEILPLILKENPNFRESVGRLWKIGRIEEDYWREFTSELTDVIDNEVLSGTHQAARLRMYKACLDRFGPGQALAHTLFRLDEAWNERRVGAVFQFPGDKTATITSSSVVFSTKD